ncbi:MAG: hypothetical protein ACOYWZ_01115 [Bacillota bacterium]
MANLKKIRDEAGSQREYLQMLCNKFGDFKVCSSFTADKGEICWTKHYSVLDIWHDEAQMWRLDSATHRTILPNEVVLDLDEQTDINLHFAVNLLDRIGINYEVFSTGSRGYHIHILFNSELSAEARKDFLMLFNADRSKASSEAMIAIEFARHWKSHKIKSIISIKS